MVTGDTDPCCGQGEGYQVSSQFDGTACAFRVFIKQMRSNKKPAQVELSERGASFNIFAAFFFCPLKSSLVFRSYLLESLSFPLFE